MQTVPSRWLVVRVWHWLWRQADRIGIADSVAKIPWIRTTFSAVWGVLLAIWSYFEDMPKSVATCVGLLGFAALLLIWKTITSRGPQTRSSAENTDQKSNDVKQNLLSSDITHEPVSDSGISFDQRRHTAVVAKLREFAECRPKNKTEAVEWGMATHEYLDTALGSQHAEKFKKLISGFGKGKFRQAAVDVARHHLIAKCDTLAPDEFPSVSAAPTPHQTTPQPKQRSTTASVDLHPGAKGWDRTQARVERCDTQWGVGRRIVGRHAQQCDYSISEPDRSVSFIRFVLRLEGDGRDHPAMNGIYIRCGILDSRGVYSQNGWLNIRDGSQEPERHDEMRSPEWYVYTPFKQLGDGWVELTVDVKNAVAGTFPKSGHEYRGVIGLRFRGSMSIAKVELLRG